MGLPPLLGQTGERDNMTTHAFQTIENGEVILISGGVYRLAEIVRRKEHVFARYGAGFVRLYYGGATSKSKMRWEDITVETGKDKFGRMIYR